MARVSLLVLLAGLLIGAGRPASAQSDEREKKPPSVDAFGDPLPPGAAARVGTTRLWQPGTLGALAFSWDGKLLASGGLWSTPTIQSGGGFGSRSINDLWLWDVASGQALRKLVPPISGIS